MPDLLLDGLAIACDNPTGRVTITGATRWEFDGEPSSQPIE